MRGDGNGASQAGFAHRRVDAGAGSYRPVFRSAGAQQSTVKPVATVKQLHEAMITPSSDALFDVGREAPKDEKGWAALRNNALILAESGNLLMLAGRAKDNGAWIKLPRELVDGGAAALKAVEAGTRTRSSWATSSCPFARNATRV